LAASAVAAASGSSSVTSVTAATMWRRRPAIDTPSGLCRQAPACPRSVSPLARRGPNGDQFENPRVIAPLDLGNVARGPRPRVADRPFLGIAKLQMPADRPDRWLTTSR